MTITPAFSPASSPMTHMISLGSDLASDLAVVRAVPPTSKLTPVLFFVTKSEPPEKVTKILVRAFAILGELSVTLSRPMHNLVGNLRNSIVVFDSFKIFGATRMLVCPDAETGKYLLLDPKKNWQKKADRVCLFVHSSFKTLKGLVTVGLAKYGALAKNMVGQLSVFTFIMDSFIVLSAAFGAWDGLRVLPKECKEADKAQNQFAKWEKRRVDVAVLSQNDEMQAIQMEQHYEKKIEKLTAEVEKLRQEAQVLRNKGKDPVSNDAKIEKLEAKKAKYEALVKKIKARAYPEFVKELAAPIAKKYYFWDVRKYNTTVKMRNTLFGIINAVGKVAVVTFALTLTALSVQATPWVVSLLALGIIVECTGILKIYYKEFNKPIKVT